MIYLITPLHARQRNSKNTNSKHDFWGSVYQDLETLDHYDFRQSL
jgi:hypothetical protein